jgi:hypothetical protein
MSNLQPLTLIVPDFTLGWRSDIARDATLKVTWLEKILGRGSVDVDREAFEQRTFEPWQWRLLKTLGLDPAASAHASAPLCWLAQTQQRASHCLHAEAVHFASSLDNLDLRRLEPADAADVDELFESLADFVGDAGFELRRGAPGAWYLHASTDLQVTTCCPSAVAGVGMYECMPQGTAARELQRLMTELQMRLHPHPVNHARASRGQAQINAVWFWGHGALTSNAGAKTLRSVFGNNDYAQGLCEHYGSALTALPESAKSNLPPDAVVLLPFPGVRALEEQWLVPLLKKVRTGAIPQLELWLDDVHVMLGRSQLRRFWRGAKSLSEVSDHFTLPTGS